MQIVINRFYFEKATNIALFYLYSVIYTITDKLTIALETRQDNNFLSLMKTATSRVQNNSSNLEI